MASVASDYADVLKELWKLDLVAHDKSVTDAEFRRCVLEFTARFRGPVQLLGPVQLTFVDAVAEEEIEDEC